MWYRIPSGICDPADDGLHLRGDSNRQRRQAGLRDRGSRRLCRFLPRTDTCLKSCRQKSIGPRQRQCAVSPPRLSEMNEACAIVSIQSQLRTESSAHHALRVCCQVSTLTHAHTTSPTRPSTHARLRVASEPIPSPPDNPRIVIQCHACAQTRTETSDSEALPSDHECTVHAHAPLRLQY